jgi:energy-coupling factor transporter ATP-binding protein EcfA2
MDLVLSDTEAFRGLAKINVVLGKNGAGKSYLLKRFDDQLRSREGVGQVRYLSPERGGLLLYEPNVETNMLQNELWLPARRRQNQSADFRQQSAILFRRLELLTLREIERDQGQKPPRYFQQTRDLINSLLDRVRIEADAVRGFRVVEKITGQETRVEEISSGEAELISLGIEILVFASEASPELENVLLIDEPDVHLHPDLQDRLAKFIIDVTSDKPFRSIVATHSTSLLAALASDSDVRIAFARQGLTDLTFRPVSDVDRAILPVFGAHPLSNVFNQAPVLLVEGDDDEWIWHKAVQASQGRIRAFPCVVDGVDRMVEFEEETSRIIDAVYDNAQAFSLRDRDLHPEEIADVGHVARLRLSCRASENLMLADDTLALAGITWEALIEGIATWVGNNPNHKYIAEMRAFVEGGLDRKGYDLKDVRNILAGLMTNKPWEVLVGQAIAALDPARNSGPDSLGAYLGDKVCATLLTRH